MTYYIEAFFIGMGVIVVAGSLLTGALFSLTWAAERICKYADRKWGYKIRPMDVFFAVFFAAPILALSAYQIGSHVLTHNFHP